MKPIQFSNSSETKRPAYIPGGAYPRPDPAESDTPPAPIDHARWHESLLYLKGVRLFNAGYYWEAHEAWEALWHAHGRRGPIADLLKGLIKLAAAGVKIRQRIPDGAITHSQRAAALFAALRESQTPFLLGLSLARLEFWARELSDNPPIDPAPKDAPISIVFPFRLEPGQTSS